MAQRSLRRDRNNQLCDRRFKRVGLTWTWSANSHPGLRRVSRIKGRTHVSTRPRAAPIQKFFLRQSGRPHMSQSFGVYGSLRVQAA
jgi:hypothetical protein